MLAPTSTSPIITGAADLLGTESDLAPWSFTPAPGAAPGRRARGASGIEVFVDRKDLAHRSSSPRNVADRSQMHQSARLPPGQRSPEALERQPKPSFSDRTPKPQAVLGHKSPSDGITGQTGKGGAPGDDGTEWASLDPRFDTAPSLQPKEVSGDFRRSQDAPLVDQGTVSSETPLRGAASQTTSAPGRSSRPVVSPFDLGAPSTGGDVGLGASGRKGKSLVGHATSGTGAQTGTGSGESFTSTRASHSDPYFYEMYRKIDRELRFPKKLALALEQGQVVLAFRLQKNGRVRGLRIHKGSGFKEFDKEALRAFRLAAPFGVIPQPLLGERSELRVIAPYDFRNPLIR